MENKYLPLIKCLSSRGVHAIDKVSQEDDMENHIKAIANFNKLSKGYESAFCRFPCNIGKVFENYKIMLRKYEKYLQQIRWLGPENKFQDILLKYGEMYSERAQKSIEQVYLSNYIELIKRSMKNQEICLGNTSLKNIAYINNKEIEVVSFEKCCINMVEMDGIYYLVKNKKRGIDRINEEIRLFCNEECLDENSYTFMNAIVSYPYVFIRCCLRYKEKPLEKTMEDFIYSIEKAIKKEGDK